jgi:hypothetical protein
MLVVTLVGCRGALKPLPVVAVQGKVTDKVEKPVAGVVVQFWPTDEALQQRMKPAQAMVDEHGQFQLACPPGKYKVTVFAPPQAGPRTLEGTPSGPPAAQKSASIPEVFRQPSTTWLTVDVPEQGASNVVVSLK